MNEITMKMQADQLIRMALQEDITSEDVSTNAVMPTATKGTVDLIAKEDGHVKFHLLKILSSIYNSYTIIKN